MPQKNKKEKVLVVAAHPDDEILGCGGAIALHKKNGDDILVLIMAEGITSRLEPGKKADKELKKLHAQAFKANAAVGAKNVKLCAFPDNRMDSVDMLDVVKVIEKESKNFKPTIVYTHFPSDLNVDHQITSQAVQTAFRPIPGSSVKKIIFFEIPSSTDWQLSESFKPNYFVDISRTLKQKIKALHAYASEMRPWPHARSYKAVENLARQHGAVVGRKACEAFVCARVIEG
ncbi:PIG-L family deacetylase [bacterium]|nr:PIG-L family deacetylase [bacterium]